MYVIQRMHKSRRGLLPYYLRADSGLRAPTFWTPYHSEAKTWERYKDAFDAQRRVGLGELHQLP